VKEVTKKVIVKDFYFDVLLLLVLSLLNLSAISWFSSNLLLGLFGGFSFLFNIGYWFYFVVLVNNDSYIVPKGDGFK
jgi:hypothetical protein